MTPHYESVRSGEGKTAKVPAESIPVAANSNEPVSEEILSPTSSQVDSPAMDRLQKANLGLSADGLTWFVKGCQSQLDHQYEGLVHFDQVGTGSRNDSRTSSKRSREDTEDSDSEPIRKKSRRSLAARRPRTRAFLSNSSDGLEVSFRVRLGSPSPAAENASEEKEEKEEVVEVVEPVKKVKAAKGKAAMPVSKGEAGGKPKTRSRAK